MLVVCAPSWLGRATALRQYYHRNGNSIATASASASRRHRQHRDGFTSIPMASPAWRQHQSASQQHQTALRKHLSASVSIEKALFSIEKASINIEKASVNIAMVPINICDSINQHLDKSINIAAVSASKTAYGWGDSTKNSSGRGWNL